VGLPVYCIILHIDILSCAMRILSAACPYQFLADRMPTRPVTVAHFGHAR